MTEAPGQAPEPVGALAETADSGGMPRVRLTRQRAVVLGVFVVLVVAFLYLGLPRLAGIDETLKRIREGDPWWLLVCVIFEFASFGGYIWLFRAVFVHGSERIGWRESYQITMAGLAATRIFAAAGAGGAALTAWALRRSGMRTRTVASRMVAQYVLLYSCYMLALVVGGVGMYTGVFHGGDDIALTLGPALFGLVVLALGASCALIPGQIDRRLAGWAHGSGRTASMLVQLSKVPAAIGDGVREALRLVREREWGITGAGLWWLFDVLTLWAAFHAFGSPPPLAVIVMAYFIGMLANLLPLPGGIGGVDGGMIGALLAFGVDSSLAVVSVLTYRAFAFWLPTVPGVVAYLQLRKTVDRWRDEGAPDTAELAAADAAALAGGSTAIQPDPTVPTSQRTQTP
ncbi:unannotated protein [freshwater metagenome]|uniref:Unannotated protein n=1 Tax=freshwater metagenome TaxID=449393 RepID=A0A6J7E9R9_9ZZZZ|nr:flippase-like domain-containing protein [Actinomycetota bacterium]